MRDDLAENDPIVGWRKRPVTGLSAGVNAMTVDVEDYFQVDIDGPRVNAAPDVGPLRVESVTSSSAAGSPDFDQTNLIG